ncbi:MAG: BlaI/MecI/CopY family transcriptional regulator [Acidobacteriia bacterium]|nr:BlaI/MecI/CopY family transcriptional regulator [Terriglobia bacterium]
MRGPVWTIPNTVAEPAPIHHKLTPKPTRDRRHREHAMFLTVQELELMKIVWDLGEASVAQVRQRYQPERSRAYTTIMTVLSRLEKKGMLKQRKSGKAFFYSAVHSREVMTEAVIDELARIFFNSSRDSLAEFCRRNPSVSSPPARSAPNPGSIDETLL